MRKGIKKVGLNILVVDDEQPIAESIRAVLKDEGTRSMPSTMAKKPLVRLAAFPVHYHIMIMDHLMHNVSGLEFLVQLPMNVFKGKIIVLSGFLTPGLDAKYRALGVDRIMRKPFGADELRQAVEALRPTKTP